MKLDFIITEIYESIPAALQVRKNIIKDIQQTFWIIAIKIIYVKSHVTNTIQNQHKARIKIKQENLK